MLIMKGRIYVRSLISVTRMLKRGVKKTCYMGGVHICAKRRLRRLVATFAMIPPKQPGNTLTIIYPGQEYACAGPTHRGMTIFWSSVIVVCVQFAHPGFAPG